MAIQPQAPRKPDRVSIVALRHPLVPDLYLYGRRSDTRKWQLPGGHCNDGESCHAGAARELSEETGAASADLREAHSEDRDEGRKVVTLFLGTAQPGVDLREGFGWDPDDEFCELKWLSPYSDADWNIDPKTDVLRHYLEDNGLAPGQYRMVASAQFIKSIQGSYGVNRHIPDLVKTYQPEQFAKHSNYLSGDGMSGYSIRPDGTLVNVFSSVRGRGDEIVRDAIAKGAEKLQAKEGYLTDLYGRHGFRKTGEQHGLAWMELSKGNQDPNHMTRAELKDYWEKVGAPRLAEAGRKNYEALRPYLEKSSALINESGDPLMNRIEDKYLVPKESFQQLYDILGQKLREGDPDTTFRHGCNRTIYLDSPHLDILRAHMNGTLPRYKIRIRQYSPVGGPWDSIAFVEVKLKEAGGETKKIRFKVPAAVADQLTQGRPVPITKQLEDLNPEVEPAKLRLRVEAINGLVSTYQLARQVDVSYQRWAFSSKRVRVTIDEDLKYQANRFPSSDLKLAVESSKGWKRARKVLEKLYKDVMILEVKHDGVVPEWLIAVLKKAGAKRVRESKYVTAMAAYIKTGSSNATLITGRHDVSRVSGMFGDIRKSEIRKGLLGDWRKQGYTIHPKDIGTGEDMIYAHDRDGNKVGSVQLDHVDDKNIFSVYTQVHPDHRRKGLATAMYQAAEKATGKKMLPVTEAIPKEDQEGVAGLQSPAGQALWAQPKRSFGKTELGKYLAKAEHGKNPLEFGSQPEVSRYLGKEAWALFTPHPAKAESFPHKPFKKMLKRLGYYYLVADAQWGDTHEPAYLVHGMGQRMAQMMGRRFGQPAVIVGIEGRQEEIATEPGYKPMGLSAGHTLLMSEAHEDCLVVRVPSGKVKLKFNFNLHKSEGLAKADPQEAPKGFVDPGGKFHPVPYGYDHHDWIHDHTKVHAPELHEPDREDEPGENADASYTNALNAGWMSVGIGADYGVPMHNVQASTEHLSNPAHPAAATVRQIAKQHWGQAFEHMAGGREVNHLDTDHFIRHGKLKPALQPTEFSYHGKSELAKSKNVRERRREVFGGWKTGPKSEQRRKQMEHIARYAEKRYNAPVVRAAGKQAASGKIIDKPDLTTGNIEHIGNPDSLVHELAHLDAAPEGMSMADYQQHMDDLWGRQNVEHGFKQQARLAPEYEATAREQQIRRKLGLPAHQKERTIVDPEQAQAADVPGKRVVQEWPGKPVKATDKKGNPKPGKRYLTSGPEVLSQEHRSVVEPRESAGARYTPEGGWDTRPTVDTAVNLRGEGKPAEARSKALEYFRRKTSKSEIEKSDDKMSAGELHKLLSTGRFALVSASREHRSPEENKAHTAAMHQHLTGSGAKVIPVRGRWMGQDEPSFLVANHDHNTIADLARKHDQLAHIEGESGHYQDFSHKPEYSPMVGGSGYEHGPHVDDNYAEVDTKDGPVRFRLNLMGKNESLDKADEPKPSTRIRQVADKYAESKGMKLQHDAPHAKVNPQFAGRVANAYHAMPHAPSHPYVKAAYGSLVRETGDQFRHLLNSGLKISKIGPNQRNPYKNSQEMLSDARDNNHLWYYPTESGFGSGSQSSDHPMLQPTEFEHEGKKMPANDVFRIVHDYFGHAKEGHGFGPSGEENAYRHHVQMYSPLAQKALATETRGQNSWVNFGPHAEHNRKYPAQTIYAEQKAGLLPDWAHAVKKNVAKSEVISKARLQAPGPAAVVKIPRGFEQASGTRPRAVKPGEAKMLQGENAGRRFKLFPPGTRGAGKIRPRTGSAPIKVWAEGTRGQRKVAGTQSAWVGHSGKGKQWKEAKPYKVIDLPEQTGVVDARSTFHPTLGNHPAQRDLHHGIDFGHNKRLNVGTLTDLEGGYIATGANHQGHKVVVKGTLPYELMEHLGVEDPMFSSPHREALYHNMARDFFKLGHHVPTTSTFNHNGGDYSAMRWAKGFQPSSKRNDATLNKLAATGELHKLGIMNLALGNTDRHGGNFLVGKDRLALIDHGLTFDYKNNDRDYKLGYMGKDRGYAPIPASVRQWAAKLSPVRFAAMMKKSGAPAGTTSHAVKQLAKLQQIIRSGDQNLNMHDLVHEMSISNRSEG